MDLSVVIPIYNERENIKPLYEQLREALAALDRSFEIVFVDDGSTDGSVAELRKISIRDERIKTVELRRNFGQSAALQAGFDHSSGDVVVPMDGDLQNDPADIGMMLDKLDEGFDVVHGWRKNRQDRFLNRRLPSIIANWLIAKTTGMQIHDLGCTLKAIRREIAHDLELYGEMHRFIPILAHVQGARCAEVETKHHPRRFGQTKYGIGRTERVVLDLATVKFLLTYFASPMKLFGRIGIWCIAIAMGCLATVGVMKLQAGVDMSGNPLLLFGLVSGLVAMQFFSLGLLGEVSARIYFAQGGKRNYAVRRVLAHIRPSNVSEAATPELPAAAATRSAA